MQYLPFGETFINQRADAWQTRYTFSAKEQDEATGYHFPIAIGIGARYYDSEVSVWLSVDPLASKFPGISSYAYCYNNPVNFVDPDGMETIDYQDEWEIDTEGNVTRTGGEGGAETQYINYVDEDGNRGMATQEIDGAGFSVNDDNRATGDKNGDVLHEHYSDELAIGRVNTGSTKSASSSNSTSGESNKSKTDNYVNALDLTSKGLIGLDFRINLYKNTNISFPRLGNGISTGVSIYTTGMSINDLTKGNQNLINYTDATVGLIGLSEQLSSYFTGVQYPIVGEFIAVYGFARLSFDTFWKLGEERGPRTWFGRNDYKYFE